MDILTLGLGRVLGLELGSQDVPGLKNTGVNFLASSRLRQDVADPRNGAERERRGNGFSRFVNGDDRVGFQQEGKV